VPGKVKAGRAESNGSPPPVDGFGHLWADHPGTGSVLHYILPVNPTNSSYLTLAQHKSFTYLITHSINIRATADTSLSQPTSKTTGRHCCGGTPPIAVYSDNFPIGIPMPNAPRSPNPRILSPSVMTTAYNCPYIKSQYNTNSISSAPTTSTADRGRIT